MQRLRFVTLNLWAQNGPWPARAAAVRAELLAQAPDIVGLQEVLGFAGGKNQLDELCAPLPAELYPHRAHGPACSLADARSGARSLGNALLSRFPILAQHNIALPNPRRRETRALLCALIAAPTGQLPVFVTHLDWQLDGSHARCLQVRFIADHIDAQLDLWAAAARVQPDTVVLPPILAGDFNAEPQSDEIRFLTGHHALAGPDGQPPRGVYFSDCYARGPVAAEPDCGDGPGAPGATFARRNRFATLAREPDRRLDYIFAALPDSCGRVEPLRAWRCFCSPYRPEATAASRAADPALSQAGIAKSSGAPAGDDAVEAVWPSDHYGVAVDFAI
mgnify:CR=1 FL=1